MEKKARLRESDPRPEYSLFSIQSRDDPPAHPTAAAAETHRARPDAQIIPLKKGFLGDRDARATHSNPMSIAALHPDSPAKWVANAKENSRIH
jgi:hypothetical protein